MNDSKWKPLCISSMLAVMALGTQGCHVYSAFQGARILDEGRFSVTPSASVVSFHNSGESRWMTTQYGARVGAGVGNRLEIQSRYERIGAHQGDVGEDVGDEFANGWGYNYLDIGFKYGIVEDILAIGMPIGFMFGENVDEGESWQIHPSLYLTAPVAPALDVNFSAKGLFFLNESDEDLLVAFNGGLAIRPVAGSLSLMPEMGVLFNPGENGYFWHWGLGALVEF